jgi:hypothetical protein
MDEEYNSLYQFRFEIKELCRKLSGDAISRIYGYDTGTVVAHIKDEICERFGLNVVFHSIFYYIYGNDMLKMTVNKKSVLRGLQND